MARVFVETDFDHIDLDEFRLTRVQFTAYKKRLLGEQVPVQNVSDERLLALGYDPPEPWVQRCIEQDLPNWG